MLRTSYFALFVCAALTAETGAWALPPAEPEVEVGRVPQAQAAMTRLPLRFEENRGQFSPAVRFTARSTGESLQLTARGPAFLVGGARVEIGLVHANAKPAIEPLDRLPAITNYMVGARGKWHTGIANFARVRYHDVYPGIDVVYYGTGNQLEYDFVLAPGADPNAIRMKFRGDVRVSLTPEGDIALNSGGAQVLQKSPAIFQDNRKIHGRYTLLARNEVGFHLARYDRSRPLTIDPILVYCTYMGSSGTDQITAVKMGPNGRLYVTGSTTTGEMQFVDGAYNNFSSGLTDIFLAIVDTTDNGNFALKYFSYLGGANLDVPLAMDVDAKGVAYLTGTTTSLNFPMAGSSVQTTGSATAVNSFVAAIDPSLYGGDSLIYSTYLGGTTGNQSGNGIAVDKNGFIYVIGTTRSSDFPLTTSAYAASLFGPQNAFLCKIDRNSTSMLYSSYLGGELSDQGRAIAVGTNGLVYFAASTVSKQFPMEGPGYRQTLQGPVGIVIGMMDMTKFGTPSLVYSTYFGGSDIQEVRGLSLDSKNNAIVTGYTLSTDFPITADAVQSKAGGNADAFVSVVNPTDPPHFLVYSTYFGGSQGEVAYDARADSTGNLYLTGYTLSPDLFTVNGPQPGWGNGIDLFIAKLKPGTPGHAGILFSTYLGGTGTYVGNSLALGSDGSIYVGGYGTIGLPSSPNGQGFAGGVTDGFLVVMK